MIVPLVRKSHILAKQSIQKTKKSMQIYKLVNFVWNAIQQKNSDGVVILILDIVVSVLKPVMIALIIMEITRFTGILQKKKEEEKKDWFPFFRLLFFISLVYID